MEANPNNRVPLTGDDLLPLVEKRTPLHHDRVPFIVCWSQKAGCTAILKWFFYHANLLEAALAYRNANNKLQIHNYENAVFKARPGYKQELVELIIAGKPVIKFIRCPYQRLFSSYMQLNNVWFLRKKASGHITPGISLRQRVIDFLHGQGMDLGLPISFRGYIEWLKEQAPETIDPHHAPQYTQLDESIPITYYRLEDFKPSIDSLENAFSLALTSSIQDRFSSVHHNEKQELSEHDALQFLYEARPLSQFRDINLPRVTSELLKATEFAPLISELFEQDIALYNSLDVLTAAVS